MSVLETAPGELWIGTYDGGLARWRDDVVDTFRGPDFLPTNQVRALLKAADGQLWVGTAQGISTLRDGVLVRQIRDFGRVPAYVLGLYQRQNGDVLVGTTNGYVSFAADGTTTPSAADFPARDVFGFYEDDGGRLWIASDAGLILEGRDGLRQISTANGLPSDTVFSVFPDQHGGFWLTTNVGVVRLLREGLIDALEGAPAQHILYDRSDGLAGSQINGGSSPSAYLDDKKRLWLPTARGISVLDPQRLALQGEMPVGVEIETFSADGIAQPIITESEREAVIVDRPRRLDFSFAGLSYVLPERIVYRHRLRPFDDAWSTPSARSDVSFTNLGPGSYVLEVAASLDAAKFDTQASTLRFRLEPQWTERPLTWLLGGLSLCGLMVLGFRIRVRALARNKRLLQQEVARQTEEIRARNNMLLQVDQEKTALLETIRVQSLANARQAREDELTKLPNRRAFIEALGRAQDDAHQHGRAVIVALLDLDHFKQVNDRFGHGVGDSVLSSVAQVLRRAMQDFGLAARYGGEEFAVLFTTAEPAAALAVCQDILARVAAIVIPEQPQLRVTTSIGLAYSRDLHYEKLLVLADERLYEAKQSGRNQVVGG